MTKRNLKKVKTSDLETCGHRNVVLKLILKKRNKKNQKKTHTQQGFPEEAQYAQDGWLPFLILYTAHNNLHTTVKTQNIHYNPKQSQKMGNSRRRQQPAMVFQKSPSLNHETGYVLEPKARHPWLPSGSPTGSFPSYKDSRPLLCQISS